MTKRKLLSEDSVIIFLIGFLLCQIIGLILQFVMDTASDTYVFLAYAIPQVCYIGAAFGYTAARLIEFRPLPAKENVVGIHYPIAIIFGLGIFFFALLPNYGLQKLFALIGKNPTVTVPDFTTPVNIVFGIIVICILPAIGEELVFRKVFVDGFSDYGQISAVLLSGAVFSMSHMNLAQTVHQFFLGCMLAYLYVKTKNITLTAIIHFINNFLALFLPVFTGEAVWNNLTVLGVCMAIGGVLISVGLIYLIKKLPKIDNAKEQKISLPVIGLVVVMAVMWLITAIVA